MNFRYRVFSLALFIISIVSICDGNTRNRRMRIKRAESDYVLRSCIASAQLVRKHRTNDDSLLIQQKTNSLSNPVEVIQGSMRIKYSGNKRRFRINPRSQMRLRGRQLDDNNPSPSDTPLRTIDVATTDKNTPRTFKRKDLLPELERSVSARKLDSSPSIVVIKSVT